MEEVQAPAVPPHFNQQAMGHGLHCLHEANAGSGGQGKHWLYWSKCAE